MYYLLEILRTFNTWVRGNSSVTETILETEKYPFCCLELLAADIPGLVDWAEYQPERVRKKIKNYKPKRGVWRISHNSSRSTFYVALFNLSKKESLKPVSYLETALWKKYIALTASSQIKIQAHVAGTHLVIFAWVSKLKIENKILNNKTEKEYKAETQAAIVCDLQGHTAVWTGEDEAAKILIKGVIKRLINNMWQPGFEMSWEDSVKAINFHQWLESFTWTYFGEDFVLQPRKGGTIKY